jgi:hypothetical protein
MVTSSAAHWHIAEQTCVVLPGRTNANSQFEVAHSTILTRLQTGKWLRLGLGLRLRLRQYHRADFNALPFMS